MDANTAPSILAERLRARELCITISDGQSVNVANLLNPDVSESVRVHDGRYITIWGYEFAETSDEAGTALRIACLLGLPNRGQGDWTGALHSAHGEEWS